MKKIYSLFLILICFFTSHAQLAPYVYKSARIRNNEMVFEINNPGLSRLIWYHTRDDRWLGLLQFPKETGFYELTKVPELDKVIDRYIARMK